MEKKLLGRLCLLALSIVFAIQASVRADPYADAVVADSPLAFYRLNEGPDNGAGNDGVIAYDSVGGHNGYYSNVVLQAQGYDTSDPGNFAAVFGQMQDPADNGAVADNMVTGINGINFGTPTTQTTNFSVEAWVNLSSSAATAFVLYENPAATNTAAHSQWSLDNGGGNGGFRMTFRNASGVTAISATSSTAPVLGNWYHVVGVVSLSAKAEQLYINGVLAATNSTAISATTGVWNSFTSQIMIGSKRSSGAGPADNQMDGKMADVAIYPYALTAAQVQNHYQASIPVTNNPPGAPVNIAPASGAANVGISAELTAAVSDAEAVNMLVTFYGRVANLPAAPDFSIIALPDTQFYAQTYGSIYKSQTDWVVANAANLNIAYVAHLGDCVESGDNSGDDSEWRSATNALYTLEDPMATQLPDGIPYGVAVGNHDQSPRGSATGTTIFYNQFFGVSHFENHSYYGGHYGTNANNFYDLFSAGGMDFIALYFEYDTTLTQTNAPIFIWANDLLKIYSSRRALVVSHYLINSYTAGSTFGAQGHAIYDAIKGNTNLFLMLCGHVAPNGEGRRTDIYNGNAVPTLLSDYQNLTAGGDGWLRIYTFSLASNVIHAQTYSPYLDSYQMGPNSQFDVPFAMTPTNQFAVIGTVANVHSGSNAVVAWSGLSPGTAYEWYATASNAVGTTAGPLSQFTTGIGILVPLVVNTQKVSEGGGVQFTFSGVTGQTYQVLASDVLNTPVSSWAVVATGTFSVTNVIFTEGVVTNLHGRFYCVRSP